MQFDSLSEAEASLMPDNFSISLDSNSPIPFKDSSA